jgi:hypothetical protein
MKKIGLFSLFLVQILFGFNYDISLENFSSPVFIHKFDSAVFQVRVKNQGTLPIDSFTIVLKEGENILESVVINRPLFPTEERAYPLVWILQDFPNHTVLVQSEILFINDEFTENNISSSRLLQIFESNILEFFFTSYQHTTSWYPFNFSFPNNLSESIYYNNEMAFSGPIYALTYLYSFQDYVFNEMVRLYMGITTQTHLANGWIPAGNLTQVYNDYYTFSPAVHFATFRFNAPFNYTSGNIVILSNRVFDSDVYTSINRFYEFQNSTYPNRTRAFNSNSQLNPNSPPTGGYLFNRMPSIIFHYQNDLLGSVSGTVSDENGNQLYGAKIVMDGQKEIFSTSQSIYRMGRIQYGEHSFQFSKIGYETYTQTIPIQSHQTFQTMLTSIPSVNVSGTVTFYDQPTVPLSNHPVKLSGYENYVTITDQNGFFSIPNVYVQRTYTLEIEVQGYHHYQQSVLVSNTDVNLGTILLEEVLYPAENVVAVSNHGQTLALVSWEYASNRSWQGFRLYRFHEYDIDAPVSWQIIADFIEDNTYTDLSWQSLPNGNYYYAVSVQYTNNLESEPTISNILNKQIVNAEIDILDKQFSIEIYPNPFNPNLHIHYTIENNEPVMITIFNSKGQIVYYSDGARSNLIWNASNEPSGIYFVQIEQSNKKVIKKAVLLK